MGNTVWHCLIRGRDRRLNNVLQMVVVTRTVHDEEIRIYARKRKADGKMLREVRRCIKRFRERNIYRIRNVAIPTSTAT